MQAQQGGNYFDVQTFSLVDLKFLNVKIIPPLSFLIVQKGFSSPHGGVCLFMSASCLCYF